jgi:hypothetical protein
VLDGLVGDAARQDPEALRALASTAPTELGQLRRLLSSVTAAPLLPQSGALSTFIQSLQLFIDAFDGQRTGSRFIDLAVPLPLSAQQADEVDAQERRLLREIVEWRFDFAWEAERFLAGSPDIEPWELEVQIIMDTCLSVCDRLIDTYAEGTTQLTQLPQVGVQEQRAAVLGGIVDAAVGPLNGLILTYVDALSQPVVPLRLPNLQPVLNRWSAPIGTILPRLNLSTPTGPQIVAVNNENQQIEQERHDLAVALAPNAG